MLVVFPCLLGEPAACRLKGLVLTGFLKASMDHLYSLIRLFHHDCCMTAASGIHDFCWPAKSSVDLRCQAAYSNRPISGGWPARFLRCLVSLRNNPCQQTRKEPVKLSEHATFRCWKSLEVHVLQKIMKHHEKSELIMETSPGCLLQQSLVHVVLH